MVQCNRLNSKMTCRHYLVVVFALVFTFGGNLLYAQTQPIVVKGSVMADSEPVIGATVMVKDLLTGTATDIDGNFTLEAPSNATLVISYIGYETVEVAINGRNSITVELTADTFTLDDIVVVGYGVQRKVNPDRCGGIGVNQKNWKVNWYQCA